MKRIGDRQWERMSTRQRVGWLRKQNTVKRKAAIVDECVKAIIISAMIVGFAVSNGL